MKIIKQLSLLTLLSLTGTISAMERPEPTQPPKVFYQQFLKMIFQWFCNVLMKIIIIEHNDIHNGLAIIILLKRALLNITLLN